MSERITPAAARALIARAGQRYATIFKHGHIELEFYAPQRTDPQQPHTRDEVYFVVAGSGTFVQNGRREPCGAGDVFYVPAGEPHRFEEFSDDFATWAIFAD